MKYINNLLLKSNSFNKSWTFASSDLASITKAATLLQQPLAWAGEDIVLVAADFLQRDIYVYIACESLSPLY